MLMPAVAHASGKLTLFDQSTGRSSAPATVSILLIEPHEICCLAISRLIAESRLTSVDRHVTHDEEEGLLLAARIHPQLIIYGSADGDRRDVLVQLREAAPGAKILFLTWDDEPTMVVDALLAGAEGIVPKSASAIELTDAIERVSSGESVIDPGLALAAALWTARKTAQLEERNESFAGLSGRELEILSLVDAGLSAQEIADRVYISRRTVESHLANSYRKLGVHERIGAIFAYRRLGRAPVELGRDVSWTDQREDLA
jgi:DNA-binding NarL/FixJ family response regulator